MGAISMDATFGTYDVKFHLFTLMVFDAHRTRVSVGCMDYYKPPNMRWFGGMGNFFENKAFKKDP